MPNEFEYTINPSYTVSPRPIRVDDSYIYHGGDFFEFDGSCNHEDLEKEENIQQCRWCGNNSNNSEETFGEYEIQSYGNRKQIICSKCLKEYFKTCNGCGKITLRNDMIRFYRDNKWYCYQCNPRGECHFHGRDIDLRHNSFKKITSKRCFGIELEIEDRNMMFKDIMRNTAFGSIHDGSLEYGVELVSPILQGDIGYYQIQKLCKYIKNKNINQNCGYHVHFDGRDLKWVDIKKIWLVYKVLEPIIWGLIPSTRTKNHYCSPIRQDFDDILRIKNENWLYESWYDGYFDECENPEEDKYNETRYVGFNLHSWFYQRTIEIRYHSGTTNFNKIINWIKMNQKIIDYALNSSINEIKRLKTRVKRIKRFKLSNSKKVIDYVLKDKSLVNYYHIRYKKMIKVNKEIEERRIKAIIEESRMRELQEMRRREEDYEGSILREYGYRYRAVRTDNRVEYRWVLEE